MHTDIFIAGAGLSGLALARALHQKNASFLLAEARDRVGGRILSIESAGAKHAVTNADMGPSWIWPGQPRIATLLDQLGIEVFEQYSSGLLVYEDESGQVRRDLDYSTMAGSLRVTDGLARLTRELATQLPADSLHLSHRVTGILQQDQGYQIDLDHAAGRLQVQANKVVLAIPPAWLPSASISTRCCRRRSCGNLGRRRPGWRATPNYSRTISSPSGVTWACRVTASVAAVH